MSINKNKFLGQEPVELGQKDAVHVAIVSLRAGLLLKPGQPFNMKDGEAVPCNRQKSLGVADPFRSGNIMRGDVFWGLMNMDEISSVEHQWEHPDHTFEAPSQPASVNKYLQSYADELQIPYAALIAACNHYMKTSEKIPYSGPLTEDELDRVGSYEIWSCWADESGHEFQNNGSECCPEYDYPDLPFVLATPEPA